MLRQRGPGARHAACMEEDQQLNRLGSEDLASIENYARELMEPSITLRCGRAGYTQAPIHKVIEQWPGSLTAFWTFGESRKAEWTMFLPFGVHAYCGKLRGTGVSFWIPKSRYDEAPSVPTHSAPSLHERRRENS